MIPAPHVILLLLPLLGACKSSDATTTGSSMNTSSQLPDYRRIAEKRLGKGIVYTLNDAQTMVLCQKTEDATTTAPARVNAIHFMVIHTQTDSVVYEDRIANGDVTWFTNTQLKISQIPGTIEVLPNRPESYYLYDLETKRKLPPVSNKL